MAGGLRHVHIKIKPLHVHLLSGCGRKLQPASLEELPVHIGKQPSAFCRFGDIAVVRPDEKQSLHSGQSGPFHVSGHHPVHVPWHGAHLDLRKPGLQDPVKFLHLHGFVSQKLHHLIQKIHHQPVDLGIFHGAHLVLRLMKPVLIFLQLPLHPVFLNKGIQRAHQLLCPGGPLHQRGKLFQQPLSEAVQPLQLIHRVLLRHFLRSYGKNIAPLFSAPDSRRQRVIFQLVHFLSGKIRQPAPQIVEHRLIAEILRDDLQGAFDVFQKRIQHDPPGPVQIQRNVVEGGEGFQIVCIGGQIPRDHRHVPVTVSGAPQVLPDGDTDLPHLLSLAGRLKERDGFCRIRPRIGTQRIAKQMLLQPGERRVILQSGHRPFSENHVPPPLHARLRGDFCQSCHRFFTQMEQLFLSARILKALPSVRRNGHDDLLRPLHQRPQHPLLHRREIHEAVYRHDRSPHQPGLKKALRQKPQRFLRSHVALFHIFPKALINDAQILQLVIQPASSVRVFRQRLKLLRPDPVLHEFRQNGLHLMDIARLVQAGTDHRGLFLQPARDFTDHQALSRVIQDRPGILPHLLKNPMGQTRKGKRVDIHDPLPGMQPHQLRLGLHAELVRNDQKKVLLRMLHGTLYDLTVQRRALSRA